MLIILSKPIFPLKIFTFLPVATSIGVMTILMGSTATARYFNYSRAYIFRAQQGWPSVALGAFLLGAGMSVAGACPGTVEFDPNKISRPHISLILAGCSTVGCWSRTSFLCCGWRVIPPPPNPRLAHLTQLQQVTRRRSVFIFL